MIPENRLKEIRDIIENSKNPLFFYDDDCDGTTAFLILRKTFNKGKGIILKSAPFLDEKFLNKVEENYPDLIVVLDIANITQEFIEKANVPIVWIDHHPILNRKKVHYLNPLFFDSKDARPTSYWAYKIAKKYEWLAAIGCVYDHYIPDFIENFNKEFPSLALKTKDPSTAKLESEIAKIIKIISFNLKGKTEDVKQSINVLLKIESPLEITEQSTQLGKFLLKRYSKLNKEYESLLEKALQYVKEDKFIVFIYPNQKTSFSTELSNELIHRYRDKIIIIGRENNGLIKMSVRSSNSPLPDKINKALVGINGYGGGHQFACGGNVPSKDFDRFLENFKKQFN
ncbi:MAG TPA: DHHA1 domain-containing protein [Candidatus Nanoarchaeia archaeon]|nr:DHHA1 domain-containing protein [Candidatus Nanoarchaeia archaeon]